MGANICVLMRFYVWSTYAIQQLCVPAEIRDEKFFHLLCQVMMFEHLSQKTCQIFHVQCTCKRLHGNQNILLFSWLFQTPTIWSPISNCKGYVQSMPFVTYLLSSLMRRGIAFSRLLMFLRWCRWAITITVQVPRISLGAHHVPTSLSYGLTAYPDSYTAVSSFHIRQGSGTANKLCAQRTGFEANTLFIISFQIFKISQFVSIMLFW